MEIRVATWNVHRARGADGRVDPARVVAAIAGEPRLATADVLALQEAEAERPPHGRLLDLAALEAATGLRSVHRHAPGLRLGPASDGYHGTILLAGPRLRLLDAAAVDLPGGLYPRAAVIADLAGEGAAVRIAATHLALGQRWRLRQMRALGEALATRPARPTLVVGDLNEWRPWLGRAFAPAVTGRTLAGPAVATFPAGGALLPLDRILADWPGGVTAAEALVSPALRAASDHRPLVARVRLAPPVSGPPTSG